MSEPTGLQDEDDFSHYFNATGRLRERAERAEAEIADLTRQRDLAGDVAVQLEQEVAVLTAERDGEIERLQQARQDAYDSYVSALNENLGLRQQVEHLSSSWGFVSGDE